MASPPQGLTSQKKLVETVQDRTLPFVDTATEGLLAGLRIALGTASKADDALFANLANSRRWHELLHRHRVGGFLELNLPKATKDILPRILSDRLVADATTNSTRTLLLTKQLLKLKREFDVAGIATIPVKDIALAHQYYDGPEGRWVGDLDLLIRQADIPMADRMLRAAGYRRTRPEFELSPLQLKRHLRFESDFEYTQLTPPHRLHLAWRIEGAGDMGNPNIADNQCPIGNTAPSALASSINAVFGFHLGAEQGWFRLCWLVDAALVLRTQHSNWGLLIEQSRIAGSHRPIMQGAHLAEELLNIQRPAPFRPKPSEERIIRALASEARRRISSAQGLDSSVLDSIRGAMYRWHLASTLEAKFRICNQNLPIAECSRIFEAPEGWFFLPRVLAFLLSLGRRIHGTRLVRRLRFAHLFLTDPLLRSDLSLKRENPKYLFQYRTVTRSDRHPSIFRFLRDKLSFVPTPRILSFGCATGEEVFSLRNYLPTAILVGYDINPRSITLAQRRHEELGRDPGISFKVAHEGSPEEEQGFDAVLCLSVFQKWDARQSSSVITCEPHLRFADFEHVVSSLALCLKPNGFLVIRHSMFRFRDTGASQSFRCVLRLPCFRQFFPRFGKDNLRLPEEPAEEVVFKKLFRDSGE